MDKNLLNAALANLHSLIIHGPNYKVVGAPDYVDDYNAIKKLEVAIGLANRDNLELRVKWVGHLREIVSCRCPKNKIGSPICSDVDLLVATCEERAEAVARTMKVWIKTSKAT